MSEPQITVEEKPKPPYHALFAPCADEEHSDCIGWSNGLRRDAELVVCSCECHELDGKESQKQS